MSTPTTSRPANVNSISINRPPGGTEPPESREDADAHSPLALGTKAAGRHMSTDAHFRSAAGSDSPPAIDAADTQGTFAGGGTTPGDHTRCDDHTVLVAGADDRSSRSLGDTHGCSAAAEGEPGQAASGDSTSILPALLDPTLALAADVLDDLERVRIANENRLRQLTRSEEDSDGETRGFGLDESHPDVARLAALVDALAKTEKDATRNLEKVLRRHPLHAWIKAQKGVGEKQAARLLASIGDPYIRPEIVREDGTVIPSGPRTVSALWAYTGLHVVPASRTSVDAHTRCAVGEGGDPGHSSPDAQTTRSGVAPKRAKGQKANWSAAAKMRAWNIAGSMLKAGNRETYDKRKAATEGRLHAVPCVRCGPSGKPAPAGSPWSDGHRHADALRVVSKELLKDLWREAKRIHEQGSGQRLTDTHPRGAAAPTSDLPEVPDAG